MTLALRSTVDVVVAALSRAGIANHRGAGPADPLAAVPYAVVHAGTVATDGPAAALFADTLPEVQVTCIGATSQQVEWLADKAFTALIGQTHTPPPGRVWLNPGTPVQHVLSRPVVRDDDFGAKAPLFYAVHIFALPSTPA